MKELSEKKIDDALAGLPASIDPDRDLWPGIQARLVSQSAGATRNGFGGAWRMAAGISVVAAAALMAVFVGRGPGVPATAVNHHTAAEIEYLQVREQLTVNFDQQLETLAPETRKVVEENLASIQKSMGEIAAALDQDPGSPMLQRLLYATYQQELSLLETINRVSGATPSEGLEI